MSSTSKVYATVLKWFLPIISTFCGFMMTVHAQTITPQTVQIKVIPQQFIADGEYAERFANFPVDEPSAWVTYYPIDTKRRGATRYFRCSLLQKIAEPNCKSSSQAVTHGVTLTPIMAANGEMTLSFETHKQFDGYDHIADELNIQMPKHGFYTHPLQGTSSRVIQGENTFVIIESSLPILAGPEYLPIELPAFVRPARKYTEENKSRPIRRGHFNLSIFPEIPEKILSNYKNNYESYYSTSNHFVERANLDSYEGKSAKWEVEWLDGKMIKYEYSYSSKDPIDQTPRFNFFKVEYYENGAVRFVQGAKGYDGAWFAGKECHPSIEWSQKYIYYALDSYDNKWRKGIPRESDLEMRKKLCQGSGPMPDWAAQIVKQAKIDEQRLRKALVLTSEEKS